MRDVHIRVVGFIIIIILGIAIVVIGSSHFVDYCCLCCCLFTCIIIFSLSRQIIHQYPLSMIDIIPFSIARRRIIMIQQLASLELRADHCGFPEGAFSPPSLLLCMNRGGVGHDGRSTYR